MRASCNVWILLSVLLAAAGCVRKPVVAPRAVVPQAGLSDIRIEGSPGKVFGHMVAVGIGLASGDSRTYIVSADRIFAIEEGGSQVAPLGVDEAARQAGGVTALVAGLEGVGAGALLSGLLGGLTGAMVGAAQGGGSGAGEGAAVGGAVGIAAGALGGFYESKSETEREIMRQLQGLYLGERKLSPGLPVSGFVFFPEGSYVGVRAFLVEAETGEVRQISGPMVELSS